jgi:hypothetical protein
VTGKPAGARPKVKLSPSIDPFRERQVPDIGGRFLAERDVHRLRADLMWLGSLVLFSDHELRLLNDLGFLCPHDLDLLGQAGRSMS